MMKKMVHKLVPNHTIVLKSNSNCPFASDLYVLEQTMHSMKKIVLKLVPNHRIVLKTNLNCPFASELCVLEQTMNLSLPKSCHDQDKHSVCKQLEDAVVEMAYLVGPVVEVHCVGEIAGTVDLGEAVSMHLEQLGRLDVWGLVDVDQCQILRDNLNSLVGDC